MEVEDVALGLIVPDGCLVVELQHVPRLTALVTLHYRVLQANTILGRVRILGRPKNCIQVFYYSSRRIKIVTYPRLFLYTSGYRVGACDVDP